MRDELVHHQLTTQVVVDQTGQLCAALDASECAALPHTAGDQLERCLRASAIDSGRKVTTSGKQGRRRRRKKLTSSGNLLPGSCDTNNDALSPALVAGFESSPHDSHVAGAVKRVVAAPVRHVDQLLLDGLAVELGRVDKVRGSKLASPRLLAVVDIDHDDLAGLVLDGSLDHGQSHTAGPEHGNVVPLAHARRDHRGAITRGDPTAQQTRPVGGDLGRDGHDGNVRHHRVLRKRRRAHEVQQILAAGLEPRGPIRHHPLPLRGPDLPAQVRLARLAELALPAFGGIQRHGIVARLDRRHPVPHRLDNPGSLVAQHNRKRSLRVFSGQRVRVGVTHARVVNLNANLMRLGGGHLDILHRQRLPSTPSHRRLHSPHVSVVQLPSGTCHSRIGKFGKPSGNLLYR